MRVSSVTSFFANSRFSGEFWFLSLSDVLSEDAVLYAASSSSLTLRLNTRAASFLASRMLLTALSPT